jgi:RNA polymerase primary sigma factor
VPDRDARIPAEVASFKVLQEELEKAMEDLNDRERKVVGMRFGLSDGHVHTLEEVGAAFGVTRERIRQIEAKTLAKLRHPSRAKKLRDFLEL